MNRSLVPFGHLVAASDPDGSGLEERDETPASQLRRWDASRLPPLLEPPKIDSPTGLSFVRRNTTQFGYAEVGWAGYWSKREFRYDAPMFQPEIWDLPGWREAFLFVVDTAFGARVIGAGACHRPEYENLASETRELAFIWFHPLYRRRGYLSRAWPLICAEWGRFIVLRPISPAMQAFLADKQHGVVHTTDAQAYPLEAYGP